MEYSDVIYHFDQFFNPSQKMMRKRYVDQFYISCYLLNSNIILQLGWLVLNNVSVNDVAVHYTTKELNPQMEECEVKAKAKEMRSQ